MTLTYITVDDNNQQGPHDNPIQSQVGGAADSAENAQETQLQDPGSEQKPAGVSADANPAAPHDPKDPVKSLLKIVHGDVSDLEVPHKSIITGKKIKNDTLRQFVETYKASTHHSNEELVEVLLAFDEAVEKEHLTEDLLEEVRRNPAILDELSDKEDAR